jgi:eukaryotic-like serine/threonine-protein kinase
VNLTPGTRVGPYEVAVLLGSGGMAEVYRARDTRLGRDVAIKMIREALSVDGPLRERFEREARLAASLSHPNVVALYDVGFQDGKPYLVTELLRGETLRERLARGPIPLRTALEWAVQMAQGLGAAHGCGIVHRDLKLENVFITRDGHVKLLDFGVSKLAEVAREPRSLMEETAPHSVWGTGDGNVVGTPGYMSPEQGRGELVDKRTDFFNFGLVLYELLCGRQAFPAALVVESAYAILHSEPEPLPASVPPPVAQVVRRCLEKDPARRYESARDLAFHLELLLPLAGSSAPTGGSSGFATRRGRRRWLWTGAAVLTAVGFATAAYFVGRERTVRSPSVQQLTFRRGAVSAGRFTPDGRVVYSAAWGSEPETIFASVPGTLDGQSLGVTSARLLGVAPGGELAVALAPLWYGPGGLGGTLALVPEAGGTPRRVSDDVLYADWSRAGELAVVRYVHGKRQLEYPIGTPIFVSPHWIGFPRISPDGDTVAFLRAGGDSGGLLLVDRKGATRRLVTDFPTGIAWNPNGKEVWFSTMWGGIWAAALNGSQRLVYQSLSSTQLEDISREGKAIINTENIRSEMAFVPPGHQQEKELLWQDGARLVALSDDGRQVLFTAGDSNGQATTYVRGTDGSSPVKLGPGWALAFSPDAQWVVVVEVDANGYALSLLPVGVGTPKKLAVSGLTISKARWLRDGKRLVVIAQRNDGPWQLFLVPLDGGAPVPVPGAFVSPSRFEISRDDRLAAVLDPDGTLAVYPLNGDAHIPLPDLGSFTVASGWSVDGQLWASDGLKAGHDAPTRLMRYDFKTRRVVEERTLSPTDRSGFVGFEDIFVAPEGGAIAYQYTRILGYLYVVDGLAPTVH